MQHLILLQVQLKRELGLHVFNIRVGIYGVPLVDNLNAVVELVYIN